MKATIRKDSPNAERWRGILGDGAIVVHEIKPGTAAYKPGPQKYLIELCCLNMDQKKRLVGWISRTKKMPIDKAAHEIARRGVSLEAADVDVVEELFG